MGIDFSSTTNTVSWEAMVGAVLFLIGFLLALRILIRVASWLTTPGADLDADADQK